MPYTFLPSYEEDRSFYIDWGDDKDFTTEDLGTGECAGGAYEMMEGFLFEADQEVHLAGVMTEKGQTGHAVNKAYRAVVAAAKGLLVLEGIDSSIDAEVLSKAETHLVGKGMLPEAYANLTEQMKDLGPKSPSVEFAHEKIDFARSFVAASHTAFDQFGSALKSSKGAGAPEVSKPAPKASHEKQALTKRTSACRQLASCRSVPTRRRRQLRIPSVCPP